MDNEKLILEKLMEISKTQGEQGAQLEAQGEQLASINKTLNNGLKTKVYEISKKLDTHLTEQRATEDEQIRQKSKIKRKVDLKLIRASLIISISSIVVHE